MSDGAVQARAEAWRRYPDGWDSYNEEPVDDWGYSGCQREAFCAGVEWVDANPKPRTITRAEFEEEYTYWFDGSPSRERAFEFLWALGVKVEGDE